jgi:multiple sugar transport system substrate-binding protein
MNTKKKLLSLMLCGILVLLSACSDSSDGGVEQVNAGTTVTTTENLDNEIDYNSMANIESVDTKNEDGTGPKYVSGQLAGNVKALCYYDINTSEPETTEIFAQRFGGTMEVEIASSGEWFDKLGTYISTGNSPDLVRYDWEAFPCYASKNTYTALDEWLDMDADLWIDIKDVIEDFNYAGKHFYFPSDVQPNFTIHYNRASVLEAGLKDPWDLYQAGEWNWNTFKQLCEQWVDQSETHIGFTGGSWTAMMFANSTGVKTFDVTGDDIINNLRSENVERAMSFLADMKKGGLIADGYMHPGEAFVTGDLLFLAMGYEWGIESAQETIFEKGLNGDMVTLPIPKDPLSDTYYVAADTFGYMVPAGAPNVQGGVDWILSSRIYESDPETKASDYAKKTSTDPIYYDKCPQCKYDYISNNNADLTVCPECQTARREKFKPVYTVEQLELIDDMLHSDKFELVFDNAMGIDTDLQSLLIEGEESLFDGPIYFGTSYAATLDSQYQAIEAYVQPYRDQIKKAAAEA